MEAREATVLVTGGAGYIGSHAVVKLLENGNKVVAIDNLVNSYQDPSQLQPESLIRAQALTGRRLYYENVDLLNSTSLKNIFKKYKIDCVMHFAALKAVGESCSKPLEYYRNNVVGTINLLDAMREAKCYRIIYSSSATVYGDPTALPLTETSPTGACTNPYGATKHTAEMIMNDLCSSKKLSKQHKAKVFRLFRLLWTVASNINPLLLPLSEKRTTGQGITNPYGRTKLIGEMILQDLCVSKDWKVIALRYFNPVGAHESGKLGEDPAGIPSNLMPYIAQVAIGKLEKLNVYGNDYPTPDGTGVRDYIHIQDLAHGHIKALDKIFEPTFSGFKPYNLGTGKGHSVLEVIHSFEKACGRKIKYEIAPRREGDVASCYCDARLANKELNWVATKTLQDMCEDMWKWQMDNPNGYVQEHVSWCPCYRAQQEKKGITLPPAQSPCPCAQELMAVFELLGLNPKKLIKQGKKIVDPMTIVSQKKEVDTVNKEMIQKSNLKARMSPPTETAATLVKSKATGPCPCSMRRRKNKKEA